MSDLDFLALDAEAAGGGDKYPVAVGQVLEVDPVGSQVRVSVRGSEGTWIAANADRYRVRGFCNVLLDPSRGGRSVLVLGARDPVDPVAITTLVGAPDDPSNTAVVVWPGGNRTIPFIPALYATNGEVWITLDDWGRPVRVDGPSDVTAPPPPPSAAVPPPSAATAQARVTIFPQWSGTYRVGSTWDRWNATRSEYGGRSTLYQGNGFGSGPVKGLATYGDQVANLGATSILDIRVRTRGVGLSGASGPAVVQGSPHGSRPDGAPASSGDTATEVGGWASLSGPTREAFRVGTMKGLALVGANYWATAGAGNGDGMALDVLFDRPV